MQYGALDAQRDSRAQTSKGRALPARGSRSPPGNKENRCTSCSHFPSISKDPAAKRRPLLSHRLPDLAPIGCSSTHLQALQQAAAVATTRRYFLTWVLYLVRKQSLRALLAQTQAHNVYSILGRYFARWARQAHHQLMQRRQQSALIYLTRRSAHHYASLFFTQWQRFVCWSRETHERCTAFQKAQTRRRQRSVLRTWCRRRTSNQLLRCLHPIEVVAQRRLARRYLLLWQRHTLERQVVCTIQEEVAAAKAVTFFHRWARFAFLRSEARESLYRVLQETARDRFVRWKLWLARRLLARRMERTNALRLLSSCFMKWMYGCRIESLRFAHAVQSSGLPDLSIDWKV